MDNFDLYKISTAKLAGKSCNTDCLFCISGAGRIRKKRNILRNIIQNVRKSTLICTTQGKCYDLSSCFSIHAFTSSRENFPEPRIKREVNSWPPRISLSSFVFAVVIFMSTFLYVCLQKIFPPIYNQRLLLPDHSSSAFSCNLSVSYCRGIYT